MLPPADFRLAKIVAEIITSKQKVLPWSIAWRSDFDGAETLGEILEEHDVLFGCLLWTLLSMIVVGEILHLQAALGLNNCVRYRCNRPPTFIFDRGTFNTLKILYGKSQTFPFHFFVASIRRSKKVNCMSQCTEMYRKTVSKVIWVGTGAFDAILSQINKKIGNRFHFQWHSLPTADTFSVVAYWPPKNRRRYFSEGERQRPEMRMRLLFAGYQWHRRRVNYQFSNYVTDKVNRSRVQPTLFGEDQRPDPGDGGNRA